jgi:hypothetical protein
MSDVEELAVTPVDPDTLQRQRDLIDLERWALRRWLAYSPSAARVDWRVSDPEYGGAASPAERTTEGNDQDPFHGVAIFNPTPWPIGVGFQAGAPARPILTVPAASWLCVPQRFTNLSVRLFAPTATGGLDATTAPAASASVLRLRMPPLGVTAGPLAVILPSAPTRGVALPLLTAIGAAGQVTADLVTTGALQLVLAARLVTVTAADLTLTALPWEPVDLAAPNPLGLPPDATQGPTLSGGSSLLLRRFNVGGLDRVRAVVGNAGAGATTAALSFWLR